MEQTHRAIVAGFDERHAAEEAADRLLASGFNEDEVMVAVRDHDYAASGGVMVRSEEEDAISHLAHLIGLTGVPEDESRRLAVQFDSKDAVLAVDADDRSNEARAIVRDFGGDFNGGDGEPRPEWSEAHQVFRGHWEERSGAKAEDRPWQQAQAGYHYVYEKAVDPEFRGRTWESAEPALQSGFEGWAAERGYQVQSNAWKWLADTLHEIWSSSTRGAAPDDIVHPERLHRWIRLQHRKSVAERTTA